MSYTALYRRYRPLDFDAMVGQSDTLSTLKNQVQNKKIGHAYIFSGTRGTGKTSAAKIFSRAINCTNLQGYNPCNACESCLSILDESSMDVIEMDAASHNGVDDVREIRENVKFPPSKSFYKVYIVDEVHMLSTGAFNALLKTLEEPPEYVVFLLATTEHHKIPATIQSRCQKFEFTRISQSDIMSRLKEICRQAEMVYEEPALTLLLKKADGSVRDCLSLMDQAYNPSVGLTEEHVRKVLGMADEKLLWMLAKAIVSEDLTEVLNLSQRVVQSANPVSQFIKELQELFRNLMLFKASEGLAHYVDGDEHYLSFIKEVKDNIEMKRIISIIERLGDLEGRLKWSTSQRIGFETGMASLCLELNPREYAGSKPVENSKLIDQLLKRIEILESKSTQNLNRVSNEVNSRDVLNQKKNADKAMPVEESSIISGEPIEFDVLKNHWEKALLAVKKVKVTTHALLAEAKPWSLKGNVLTLAYPDDYGFHMDALMRDDNRQTVENAISHYFKTQIRISCDLVSQLKENNSQPTESNAKIEDMMGFFEGFEEKLEIIED